MTHDGTHGDDCFGCKVKTIQLGTDPFKPHFNHAVGEYVSNRSQFEDALRRGSARNSERTGIDHSYAALYPGDVPQPTKSDDIFETRARVLRDGPSAIPPMPEAPPPINYDREVAL